MIKIVRASLIILICVAVFKSLALPEDVHRLLDPGEPIAADGSTIAGKAPTIYDTNPLLGAFSKEPEPDPDDPKDFQWRIENDRWTGDHVRNRMAEFIGPLGASRCEDGPRKTLISAARNYYRFRGSELHSFELRGPKAKAAIKKEWTTPLDQKIDGFLRAAIQSGYLHKDELPANVYPEFAKVFADIKEIGSVCPPLRVNRANPDL